MNTRQGVPLLAEVKVLVLPEVGGTQYAVEVEGSQKVNRYTEVSYCSAGWRADDSESPPLRRVCPTSSVTLGTRDSRANNPGCALRHMLYARWKYRFIGLSVFGSRIQAKTTAKKNTPVVVCLSYSMVSLNEVSLPVFVMMARISSDEASVGPTETVWASMLMACSSETEARGSNRNESGRAGRAGREINMMEGKTFPTAKYTMRHACPPLWGEIRRGDGRRAAGRGKMPTSRQVLFGDQGSWAGGDGGYGRIQRCGSPPSQTWGEG